MPWKPDKVKVGYATSSSRVARYESTASGRDQSPLSSEVDAVDVFAAKVRKSLASRPHSVDLSVKAFQSRQHELCVPPQCSRMSCSWVQAL